MKNIAISKNGSTKTVSHQDLIDVMIPNFEYTVEEVVDLLPDSPKTSVRDTLMSMVDRGVIWRNASQSRIKFALLQGEQLRDAVERKTTRLEVPTWMKRDLVGYDASMRLHRELSMTVRK